MLLQFRGTSVLPFCLGLAVKFPTVYTKPQNISNQEMYWRITRSLRVELWKCFYWQERMDDILYWYMLSLSNDYFALQCHCAIFFLDNSFLSGMIEAERIFALLHEKKSRRWVFSFLLLTSFYKIIQLSRSPFTSRSINLNKIIFCSSPPSPRY